MIKPYVSFLGAVISLSRKSPRRRWTALAYSLLGCAVLPIAMLLAGCQASTPNTPSGSGGVAPVISSFTATPSSIVAGKSTTLTWSVSGATTLSIDHGVGTVSGTSATVTPSATTNYTLTATNAYGSAQLSASVTVTPAPTPSFTSTPPSSAIVGTAYTYTPQAVETGATITFSVTSTLPSGASFSGATLTWTPTAAEAGVAQSFTIQASDGAGGTTTQTWSVTPSSATSYAYTIVDLGKDSSAYGISDTEIVVGANSTGPAYWDANQAVHQITTSNGVARAISSGGTIVGELNPNAVAWLPPYSASIDLPYADTATMAIAINSSDHIVGGGYFWSAPSASATATVLQKSAANSALAVLGISDADVIVGAEQTTATQVNPVYWSSPTAKPQLLTLPFGDIGGALGISHGGAITGYGKDSINTNITHAIFWSSPGAAGVDLEVLPGVVGINIPTSEGVAVNDAGIVVGYSSCSAGMHAFVWLGSGAMQDLNSVSDASTKNLTLTGAGAINRGGFIVGTAVSTIDSSTHAFLAIPNIG